MKRRVITLLAFVVPLCSFSQTAQWATLPTYDAIEDYIDSYLKVYKGTQMGVATLDGKEIIPAQYDHITAFVDGYALALNRVPESKEWRISAIIQREEMKYTVLTETYYNTKYSYPSNGRIVVKGKKGLGYIDVNGNLVIPCKYAKAYPFSEGLASVVEKNLHYYITTDGQLAFRPSGKVYREAFSFHKGSDVVYIDGNTRVEGYVINKRGQELSSHSMEFAEAMDIAKKSKNWSLHIEQSVDKMSSTVPLLKDGVVPFLDNGSWGYKKNEYMVLLPQFEQAEPFTGGYAKVKKGGKWGVLKLHEGSFSASLSRDMLEVINGRFENLQYSLSVPEVWKSKEAVLICKEGERSETLLAAPIEMVPLILDVPLKLQGKEEQKCLHFTFSADNLLLWEDMKTVSFTYPIYLKLSKPMTTQEKADAGDKMVFKATIENPYEEAVTTNITVRVKGHDNFEYIPKSATIGAKGKTEVFITLAEVHEEKTVDLTVRLSDSRRTTQKSDILLKPFY